MHWNYEYHFEEIYKPRGGQLVRRLRLVWRVSENESVDFKECCCWFDSL